MNRTDRLYALVEELRAVAPRPRSAAWLARRFEVSVRTVERDLEALRQSGVPVWSEAGRTGGYTLDRERTLPPLALTADEALAIAVALRSVDGSPFAEPARSASLKVRAGLPTDVRRTEELLADRVHRVGEHPGPATHRRDLLAAVLRRQVLQIGYVDAAGAETERDVEPLGLLWGPAGWYLLAWCRLRGGVRGFQVDRIRRLVRTDETAPERAEVTRRELDRIQAQPLQE